MSTHHHALLHHHHVLALLAAVDINHVLFFTFWPISIYHLSLLIFEFNCGLSFVVHFITLKFLQLLYLLLNLVFELTFRLL